MRNCIFYLLALHIVPAIAQQQPSASVPGGPISLAQVSVRSEELSRLLRDTSRHLPSVADLAALGDQLAEQDQPVGNQLKESEDLIANSPTILEIHDQVRAWEATSKSLAQQRKMLAGWAQTCDESIQALDKEGAVWKATLQSTEHVPELEPTVARIRQAVADIQAASKVAEERLRTVVNLQNRVSQQDLAVADIVDKLGTAAQGFQGRLFHRDAYPIWKMSLRRQNREPLNALVNRSLGRSYSNSSDFFEARKGLIAVTAVLFFAALAGVLKLRRMTLKSGSSDPGTLQALRVLNRPWSLTVLIIAAPMLAAMSRAPNGVVAVMLIVFLVPITRVLPVFARQHARLIYLFSGFYLMSALLAIADIDPSLKRELIALFTLTAICLLVWLERLANKRRGSGSERKANFYILIIRSALIFSVVVLAANVFGFVTFSQLLRQTALFGSYFGLMLFSLVRVTNVLFALVLRLPRVSTLAAVRLHGEETMKWAGRGFVCLATAFWIVLILNLLTLKGPFFSAISEILGARLPLKSLNFSLGDLLAFVLVLTVGFSISNGIRFVLREEILSRLRLQRGLPEMLSTSLHYLLLLIVFFAALNAAGIQLDKLTVLTGAFGVGIGFGLQNVVNNFVSGLILQFERPIHIGDVLEVGTLVGEVRRIGVRSSTVRTFQGAEVIIPNSTFVSGQVINWTLSESRRRVELPVGVAYGNDPERVIQLLINVAKSHPEVLKEPAPAALFKGFGASSLDFELYFWAEQNMNARLRSDVAIGVNAALRDAGIEIPYPQQDVHVRGIDSQNVQPESAVSADLKLASRPRLPS